MGENNGESTPALFTTDDTGNYVEYTPPEPPAFKDTLPEDLRDSEHLADVEGADSLARYYVDLKSNYLKPPDSADGYEIELPEGLNIDSDALTQFKQTAFENGLNQKQVSALVNLEAQNQKAATEKLQSTYDSYRQESEKSLKAEYGEAYEQKKEAAQRVLTHKSLASESFVKFLNDSKFGDNPEVFKFFVKLSEVISEDAFSQPGQGTVEQKPPMTSDGRPMLRFTSMEE